MDVETIHLAALKCNKCILSLRAEGSSYLEDGVHDHRQRAVSGKFCYLEYIQTPTINVLNLLEKQNRISIKTQCVCVCVGFCLCASVCGPTLASRLSCGVMTPKRGMQAGAKPGLCVIFFTPMICDIGLFFFSFSLRGVDRTSTSCCFSATCAQNIDTYC